ncbi:hypothetical protein ACQ4PT_046911 [Festuca glaucescens]
MEKNEGRAVPGAEVLTPPADGAATGTEEEERGNSGTPDSAGNIEDMLNHLEITAEEGEAIDLSGLIEENRASLKWAVIIRVCLKTSFSHTAFFQKMQVACAVAHEVSFRDIDEFTFIAQFMCLGDWKTAMHGGPWLFRRNAVVIEEYDGLVNTETIPLDSIRVWARIMGLSDLVRNPAVARLLASKMGEVLEVQMGMNGVNYGKFVRVYVKINLKKPLLRFVIGGVGPGKEPPKFRVLAGGLMLLWDQHVNIQLKYEHTNYIDVLVSGETPEKDWRLTGLYGESVWRHKHRTWRYLRELSHQANVPWMVLGDMNEILSESEKDGGAPRPLAYMQAFRDCLTDCGLEDLGFIGNKFTWKRGLIRERLDRAVGNAGWSQLFPHAGVHNLTSTGSDHRPILVDTETYASVQSNSNRRRHFEGRWLKEEKVADVVSTDWLHAPPHAPVMSKLSAVHVELHEWDRSVLKAPQKKIKELTRELDQLLSGPMSEDSLQKQKELTRQIEVALEQEEVHYMQRSQANWLLHGDRNTTFFHNYAKGSS